MIELSAGAASARVAIRGAEWQGWLVEDRDLLWRPDAAIWAETAPVLFPVVGWTRNGSVRVDGSAYPLGLHGFARNETFDVVAQGDDHVRLRLCDTPATRALYPFAFVFEVAYRLAPDTLFVSLEIANAGTQRLPYACGLHPGFAWPFAGGDLAAYRVIFDEAERDDVPVITPDGLFATASRTIPLDGRVLALNPSLFAREALCFLDARSRGLTFAAPDGSAIRIETTAFPHIALWSRPGAPFLAIEAWTGYGDPDAFAGDLFHKPSMLVLDPGARTRHEVTYRFSRPDQLRE